jgi:hypothetical protein
MFFCEKSKFEQLIKDELIKRNFYFELSMLTEVNMFDNISSIYKPVSYNKAEDKNKVLLNGLMDDIINSTILNLVDRCTFYVNKGKLT